MFIWQGGLINYQLIFSNTSTGTCDTEYMYVRERKKGIKKEVSDKMIVVCRSLSQTEGCVVTAVDESLHFISTLYFDWLMK